jgi:pimeloyl-ACP methyl ester carboxylesterase
MAHALNEHHSKTFVFAHGAWHGGWCWKKVACRLRRRGHEVHTPSYTGMGDRVHLLRRDITIDTFVDDLVQVIESEELSQVILVGHSFGGVPITGVADRIPERIAHLLYLDSVVIESGKSAFSYYPPDEVAARITAAEQATGGIAIPAPLDLPLSWGSAPKGTGTTTGRDVDLPLTRSEALQQCSHLEAR